MIFTINKNYFLEMLNKNNHIINVKALVPSLTGIALEVTNDSLNIISTNNSLSMKTSLTQNSGNLVIKEIGNALIKGKYLLEILRRMDDDEITISVVDSSVLKVIGNNNEYELNILDYNDFPLIGFVENGEKVKVDSAELKKSINQTLISVDEYNSKISLTGLNFKTKDGTLNISGTDSFRISKKIIELDDQNDSLLEKNIPFKTCIELVKILPDKGICEIIFIDEYTTFKFENTIFQTTTLDGKFPDIDKLLRNEFDSTVYIEKQQFIKIVNRADIPNEDQPYTQVNLIIDGEIMTIKSQMNQIGTFEEQFKNFQVKGLDDYNVIYNSKYLLEALRSFDTKSIELNFTDGKKPLVLTSSESPNLFQIIMPISIGA